MEQKVRFERTLDMGVCGERDVIVTARVYLPAQRREDDYPEVEVLSVTANGIDILDLLLGHDAEDLADYALEIGRDSAAEDKACAAEARWESEREAALC
jgi:hypothetical protein